MAKDTEPMERIHVTIYSRDIQRVRDYFGSHHGPSWAIRVILRRYLDNLDAKTDAKVEGAGE